jgi:hypothetical protein
LGYGKIDEWARIRTAAHSLPAAENFGASNEGLSKEVRSLWETLTTPSAGDSGFIPTSGSHGGIAGELAETQLLIAARRQGVDSLWPAGDPYSFKNVLKLRSDAEELAVPRGADGSPGDERAHYFARYALKAADGRRRLAEDVLFIGPQSTQDYAELALAANELYEWSSQVMRQATAAYAVRDAALAEAPYLGFWLCGPAIVDVEDRKTLVNELLGFVRQSHDLDQQISNPEKLDNADELPEKSGLPFYPLAGEVLKHHRSVKGAFKQKYEELLETGAQGPSEWTAVDCALMTPLIPANKRARLLAMRDEVSKNLYKEYFEKSAGAQATSADSDSDQRNSAAGAASTSAYLQEMQAWGSHPLVQILLPEESGNTANHDIAWCDNIANLLRERLSGLSSSKPGGDDAAKDRPDNDPIRDRQELSRAERALRASAAVGFSLGGLKSDPIFELRQFDLRHLLVSLGERAMDDFWGEVSQAGVEDPFFVLAAKHYFDAARNLGTPPPAVRLHLDKLQVRLAELEKSKRQPLQIRAKPELVNELRGDVAVGLEIAAKSSNYPPGKAALYLRKQSGQRLDFQFKEPASSAGTFVAYPPPSARQSFMMAITAAPTDEPKVEAVSFFRGQEDLTSFILPTFKGLRIDYEPYVYDGQTITLFGDRPEQLSLVFILDCSSSMDEQTQVEALKAKTAMRIELAKRNFASMLSDIVKRNNEGEGTRVGVRFYGHRLGWIKDGDELAKQTDYKGTIPDNLTPSEDVELVQPLGRFNGGVANKVNELLNSLKPWGETPLYLALTQALDDFNSDGPGTRKSIVAITDGQDYQSLHNLGGPRPPQTTFKKLRDKWERSKFKPPIHILGFGIAANQAAAARAEFMQVAEVTGGSYTEIKSGGDLLTQLREHLNVAGYTVKDTDGRPVNSSNPNSSAEVKLGTPVQIPSRDFPADFQVGFRNVPPKLVRIEGGEALELWVEKSGSLHNIVAHDYDRRTPLQLANLRNGAGGPETDYILRVHLPVRSESAVEFPISLQQDTREFHFTPRPAETWLEVTPLSAASSGQPEELAPYVFYDTNYVPNESVPVVVWRANEWKDWTNARISFWCKFRATDPAFAIRLRDANYRDFQSVPDLNGVQLRVETRESGGVYQVYVVENHSAQSAGVDSLRIQFQTDPQYKPSRVQHQFDRNTRIATHSFEFPSSERARIESFDGSRVLITRASDIKEGALQISGDSAIEISVQPAGVYHTTGGVSNGQ